MKKSLLSIVAVAAMALMSGLALAATLPDVTSTPSISTSAVISIPDGHALATPALASKLDSSWTIASGGIDMTKEVSLIGAGSGDSPAIIERESSLLLSATILTGISTLASVATHSPPGGTTFANTADQINANYFKFAQSATGHSRLDPTDV